MKQFNVCLILLITLFATSSKAFQFSSLMEVQDLKMTIFGSNLIETIALTFQSSDKTSSAKEVLIMLEDLRKQLQTDQTTDTKTFETKQTEFTAHIDKLATEIALLTTQIELLQKEIERLEGLIAQADLNIASFVSRIAKLKTLLIEMEAANGSDNRYYNQKIVQMQTLYHAFTTILERLERLSGSVSAVAVPTHVNLTDAERRDVEWKKANPTVASKLDAAIVKSFLQVESESSEAALLAMQLSDQYNNFLETTLNADQNALQKLIKILSAIQDEVLAQKTATQKYLDDINAQYKALKEQTEAEIILNQNALARQTENRDKYIAEKAAKIEEKETKTKRRDLLSNEKAINEDLRSKLKATFEKERIERSVELDVVSKLIKIVENRLLNKTF